MLKRELQRSEPSCSPSLLPSLTTPCIEHIFKGPAGERKLTSTSLIVFSTRPQRDAALNAVSSDSLGFSGSNSEVKFKPARTKRQMHRAWAVNKAKDLLEADPLSKDKEVTINWKAGTSNDKVTVRSLSIMLFVLSNPPQI